MSEAKQKARLLAGRIQGLFRRIRGNTMSITQEQIQSIIQAYLKETLGEDEEMRILDGPVPSETVSEDNLNIEHVLETAKGELARSNHVEFVGSRVDKILDKHRIKLDHTSKDYKLLCWEVLKAEVKAIETIQERNRGTFKELIVQEHTLPVPLPTSEPLKDVINIYFSEKEGKVEKRTTAKAKGYLDTFTFFFGEDMPIGEIDYKKMREYKEFLKKFPAGFFKTKAFKGWTVNKILNNQDPSTGLLSEKTVNHYLGEVVAFLNFAVRNGYIDKNYAQGLKITLNKAASEQRDIFQPEDLTLLFGSKEYLNNSHKFSYQYWMPLLILYSGARLEEICQLHVNDIQQVDGIWCMDITEQGSTKENPKRLKTINSDRLIPIHPFIIEDLKFLDYVDSMKAKGEVKLFPEIPFSTSEDRWGALPSKWFRTYKKDCGVEAEARQKDWHSFRHTVIDNLAQQLVPETVIKSLAGHQKEGETLGRYGKKLNVRKVYEEAILKLDFGVGLGHLKRS